MLNVHFDAFPEIETERLLLREIIGTDAEPLYQLRNNPLVIRYLDREPDKNVREVVLLIETIRKSFEAGDGITWALSLKGQPQIIGTLGIWQINKAHHRGEIGYTLAPEHWGQGLMTEAMPSVLDFAFHQIKVHSMEANTSVDNDASQSLLLRHGFVKEAHFRENWYFRGKFSDSVILCLLDRDWEAHKA